MKSRAIALPNLRPAVLLACLLAALFTLLLPGPARAHDALIGSSPANGQVLTTAPTQFDLEFSAELLPATAAFILKDSSGAVAWEGAPTIAGRHAQAPFPKIPDGAYQLAWSVVSSDGHRIEGVIPFELQTGASPSAAAPSAAPSTATPSGPPSGKTTAPNAASTTVLTTDILSPLPLYVVLLVSVAVLGPLVVLVVRNLRRRK